MGAVVGSPVAHTYTDKRKAAKNFLVGKTDCKTYLHGKLGH